MQSAPDHRSRKPHHGSEKAAFACSAAAGALLWIATATAGHQIEAWESTLYWRVAYPVLAIIIVLISRWAPRHPWRWPLVAMFAQALLLALRNSGGTLPPLDAMIFAVLTLPLVAVALITGYIVRKRRG
jgi:hypothetical protein